VTDAGQRTPAIAIVDDEEVVTRTLRTVLELETDYRVHTFRSPLEALDAMDHTRIDLVVSDFLMPEMNGLEFLTDVKKKHPDTVRVLLTGYADKENAIQAINETDLFQYLEKPWDNDQLLLVIRNGLRNRDLAGELRDKIADLDEMLRRHERLSQQHDRLREELALARRVQQTLLPDLPCSSEVCFAATYRPALDVGGDFYDLVELDGARLGVFVADTTGHGVQAALNTTLLKSTFARFGNTRAGAAEILEEMNRALHGVLPSEIFVAATLATVDPETGTVCVAGGGGPHPFLVRASGGVERIASSGLPLGAVGPPTYHPGDEITVTLEPGDRVVLYTDGLTEVEDEGGGEFGDEGLMAALESPTRAEFDQLGEHLIARARHFARDDHGWDDVTIVVVELRRDTQ
jgi:sigma-B regulation protein RsbU (phosphoserine phosphatase)